MPREWFSSTHSPHCTAAGAEVERCLSARPELSQVLCEGTLCGYLQLRVVLHKGPYHVIKYWHPCGLFLKLVLYFKKSLRKKQIVYLTGFC